MLGRVGEIEYEEYPPFVQDIHSKLKCAFEQTRQKLSISHQHQKEIYDASSQGSPFRIGNRVWLYVPAVKPGKTRKFSSLWRGPYTVLDKTSPVNYRIQLIGGTVSITVHRNRLKQCHGDPNRVILRTSKSRFPHPQIYHLRTDLLTVTSHIVMRWWTPL